MMEKRRFSPIFGRALLTDKEVVIGKMCSIGRHAGGGAVNATRASGIGEQTVVLCASIGQSRDQCCYCGFQKR